MIGRMTRYERISAPDDGQFDAYLALPESGPGPGVIVFQEIFGVNDNIRGICDRLAGEGYVALAPDMFWRLEPRFERKDESTMRECMARVQRLDFGAAVGDMSAVLAHLRGMPACTGKVGAIGFCLGGTLTYLCATASRVDGTGPDAAVPYYGSGIPDMLGQADALECPTLFHFGDRDPYIPSDQVDRVEQAFSTKPHVTVRRYDAGHAFSNWDAPSFYEKKAADEAWVHTTAFLAEYLRP